MIFISGQIIRVPVLAASAGRQHQSACDRDESRRAVPTPLFIAARLMFSFIPVMGDATRCGGSARPSSPLKSPLQNADKAWRGSNLQSYRYHSEPFETGRLPSAAARPAVAHIPKRDE
ncbi:hypothetical protein EVAR_19960_1 [Eumeta japonica]|uniref:Uncharacterized protein n=1 Tax=Eumeta variegata TaxID=151549 RepID=A0A4C1YG13_EUMVA|nr:hypothetical protein EVAR_19960_1 [Eumeta japonica]